MNNKTLDPPKKGGALSGRLREVIKSSQVDFLLSVIGAIVSLLANLLSIKASDLFTQIPTPFLTLLFLTIALVIVLIVSVVIYRQQNHRKSRILAELRKTEDDLFSKIEKNIPELLGIGGTDEQSSAKSAT